MARVSKRSSMASIIDLEHEIIDQIEENSGQIECYLDIIA
jgi:hypothetical protein